ncbi:MAG TPA: hypothetical protein H9831_03670 [Candidatus Eisenbergiella pullistercoris]|uniref:beta-fructofuranosidase n=1 Tax=Candidatus Eisenbergiella pullistercoris TaxID=2838555 RepID=A0A9D2C6E8_9FIRM|nr:hypothetical protein [Candidatus Eisenbergiella pullistercoris]
MTEKIFYSAPGARTGDVIPKYIDGKYQLFYLKGWKEPVPDGAVRGWHRMESEDLIHMGKEVPIHVQGGTGDLIFAEGKWHLFACIFPDGKQYITHYVSRDGSLDHWEYQEEDTFGPDGVIYQGPDWRDPRIEYDPETEEYRMILAARAQDGHSQTGCVGLCVSRDLKHWEYREPLYYPRCFNGACECPDIFRIGGWEYLVFSSYTNLFGTYYVKRRTGESHFQIPRNHRLDARGFYAAKTAGSETERYLFGWCPTKEENIFGFWPDGLKAQDYRTWDWGGEMVIHQLVQHPDGDLGLSLPRTRRELFAMPEENTFRKITDGWERKGEGWLSSAEDTQQMMLMQPLPETGLITAQIRMEGAMQAGVVLKTGPEMKEGYYLYVEPNRGRLVYRSWLRMSEDGGKTFPYDVELEAPVRTPEDGRYLLEILMEGSMGTAYVNGEAALSFRMYDLKEGNLGLFSLGRAAFERISLQKRRN